MICAPCAAAADDASSRLQAGKQPSQQPHPCTGGCTCQHRPIVPKEQR